MIQCENIVRQVGETWFAVTSAGLIPAEICSCAAGPDKHLQDVQFPCIGCGARHTALLLYACSDLPGHCHECAAEYYCPHGVHPEDPCAECGNA